jgi:DnaJ-domain-containing protein 1
MREDPLSKLSQRWLKALEEEMASWLQDILKDTFDPATFMAFAKSFGVDPSRLAGMATGTSAFDPYKILGLERSASDEEVKKRYHELLRHLHPDTSGVKGTEMLFQVVMAAFEQIKRERNW